MNRELLRERRSSRRRRETRMREMTGIMYLSE